MEWLEEYWDKFVPLAIVVLAYLFARAAYFRQKEYELVVRRYLNECLDEISASVDKALALYRHNWWQGTVVLKHFRDLGPDMRKDLYQNVFIEPSPYQYKISCFYRLEDLVGGDVFDIAQQYLDAFTREAYAFFQDDLSQAVRLFIKGSKTINFKATKEELISTYEEQILRLDSKVKRFYVYLHELQNLASIVQTKRFTFKSIKKIQNQKDVEEIVNRMREAFPVENNQPPDGSIASPVSTTPPKPTTPADSAKS